MSKDNNGKNGKSKTSRKQFWTRVVCGVLAALMVVGLAYMIIWTASVSAGEYDLSYVENDSENDALVRVGLMYGNSVTVGFQTITPYGYTVGVVDSADQFHAALQVSDTKVSVTCDSNLSLSSGGTFGFSGSRSNTAVCGYYVYSPVGGRGLQSAVSSVENALTSPSSSFSRSGSAVRTGSHEEEFDGEFYYIDISGEEEEPDEGEEAIYEISSGLSAFGGWVNGEAVVCVGSFYTQVEAEDALDELVSSGVLGSGARVGGCSDDGLKLIAPDSGKVLFVFDGERDELALSPIQISGKEEAYLETPAKNHYAGVFVYDRYISGNTDGVQLVNLLPLEDYVMGVLPWEISSSWPLETMKAFAIAVRSYALQNYGKHDRSYGFDLCSATDCQYYKGLNRVDDNVRRAVNETRGMVLTSGGKIVGTYYSSSTGGCTVSASDAWGSSSAEYPYLTAVITPWEKYETHSNGSWTTEYSPDELLGLLRGSGYTDLRGSIEDVEIVSFAAGSTYVYELKFTDVYGNSRTVKRSDTIRSLLGLNSANFVVGKAGETVQIVDYSLTDEGLAKIIAGNGAGISSAAVPAPTAGQSGSGEVYYLDAAGLPKKMSVAVSAQTTAEKNAAASVLDGMPGNENAGQPFAVLGADGVVEVLKNSEETLYAVEGDGSVTGISRVPSSPAAPAPDSGVSVTDGDIIRTVRTVRAEGRNGNFVFIGRGWGHGVGMSQYGMLDLGNLGCGCTAILNAYFPTASVADYHTVVY